MFTRCFFFICFLCLVAGNIFAGSEEKKKIISLSPALTAMIFELDQQEHLVGVTRFCRLPEGVNITEIGGGLDPEVELVISLQPDIILAGSILPQNIANRFESFGIPVKRFRQDVLADILEQVSWLGEFTGDPARAEKALIRAHRVIEKAEKNKTRELGPSAIVFFSDKLDLAAGGNTYADEVLSLSGFENVVRQLKQPWPSISREWLLAQDPEWIIMASSKPQKSEVKYREQCLSHWKKDATLARLQAIQSGRVIVVAEGRFGIPSLQLFSVIEELKEKRNR